jgi:predicted transcriptional regulator
MTVTTIKVDSAVRDRLAKLAAEQGRSIGAVVADLAAKTPTKAEAQARVDDARKYFRDAFGMDLTDDDLAEGERFWQQVEARKTAK